MASTWGTNTWGSNEWQDNVIKPDISGQLATTQQQMVVQAQQTL